MLLIIELLKCRRQKERALFLIQYLKMEGTHRDHQVQLISWT